MSVLGSLPSLFRAPHILGLCVSTPQDGYKGRVESLSELSWGSSGTAPAVGIVLNHCQFPSTGILGMAPGIGLDRCLISLAVI